MPLWDLSKELRKKRRDFDELFDKWGVRPVMIDESLINVRESINDLIIEVNAPKDTIVESKDGFLIIKSPDPIIKFKLPKPDSLEKPVVEPHGDKLIIKLKKVKQRSHPY